jgi:hypothetical protein
MKNSQISVPVKSLVSRDEVGIKINKVIIRMKVYKLGVLLMFMDCSVLIKETRDGWKVVKILIKVKNSLIREPLKSLVSRDVK